MKTCIKCGLPKPIEDFYAHPQMADGRLGKCKRCCKEDALRHRAENLEAARTYDRERGKLPHRLARVRTYHKTHPAVVAKAHQKYEEKYPERKAATVIVNNAIRDKRLKKFPCEVCGAINVEAHHEDYTKPLDVRWLCNLHHKEADKIRRKKESGNL